MQRSKPSYSHTRKKAKEHCSPNEQRAPYPLMEGRGDFSSIIYYTWDPTMCRVQLTYSTWGKTFVLQGKKQLCSYLNFHWRLYVSRTPILGNWTVSTLYLFPSSQKKTWQVTFNCMTTNFKVNPKCGQANLHFPPPQLYPHTLQGNYVTSPFKSSSTVPSSSHL